MSVFTPAELTYLTLQRLGRLATALADRPHVVPVSFRYNSDHDTIDIGGHDFTRRKKFRDVQRNPHVAFVVDDLASVQPWRPRGIEIRGLAEIQLSGGKDIVPSFEDEIFRIKPSRIFSWGLIEGAAGAGRNVGG
jgi:pyridoxamine 5'-phosphate oxidase family protein